MPIIAPIMSTTMISAGLPKIKGLFYPNFTMAVSNAITVYTTSPSNVFVTTVDTGILGSGIGTGAIINNNPSSLESFLTQAFILNKLIGEYSRDLVKAISTGISSALSSAIVITTVTGVSVGSGFGTIISSGPSALESLLIANFSGLGFSGINIIDISKAISQGYVQYLNTLKVSTVDAGAASIGPGTGSGRGYLI